MPYLFINQTKMKYFTPFILVLGMLFCFPYFAGSSNQPDANGNSTDSAVFTQMYDGSNPPPSQLQKAAGGDIQKKESIMDDVDLRNTVLAFTFGLIVMLLILFRVRSKEMEADDFFRLVILSLVIIAAIFLIAVGYSSQQLAPAFGLLGTIAGYLLGRQSTKQKET